MCTGGAGGEGAARYRDRQGEGTRGAGHAGGAGDLEYSGTSRTDTDAHTYYASQSCTLIDP